MSHALSSSAAVGVIGAGAMGAGIAQIAAAAGHPVLVLDLQPGIYRVTFTLPGFSTVRREGITLTAGFAA